MAGFHRRLKKEREELSTKPPAGITLDESATGDSLARYASSPLSIINHVLFLSNCSWIVRVDGAEG